MNHLVERVIVGLLEDEMDMEIIEVREPEETIEWKQRA